MKIATDADMARAIVLLEASCPGGAAEFLRALRAGLIAFAIVNPDTSAGYFKRFGRATAGRPAVVLIGDDDGLDRGPAGFRLAEKAAAWARSVVIHGAGAEVAHYRAAVLAAQLVERVLFVECSTATLPAWVDLIQRQPHKPPSLVIRPRGGLHPVGREVAH